MNIYVCSTPYHLLISLFYIYANKQKAIIYITTHEKGIYKKFLNLESKLNEIDIVEHVIIRKRNLIKDRIRVEGIRDYLEYMIFKKHFNRSTMYIFPWNPYSIYSIANFLYKKAKSVVLVEDGSNVYSYPKPSNLSQFVKKYFYNISTNFYNDEKLKKILVQYPEKYPQHLQKKLEKLDLNKMLNKLSESEKKLITSVFLPEGKVKSLMHLNSKESVIILTQPLSEDGYTTEDEKKRLYKELIIKYSNDYNVILKKHPREITEYGFNDVIELDGFFPSEIFNMLGIKFKKAIGICTSAIHYINADEKFNTDEDFLTRRKH